MEENHKIGVPNVISRTFDIYYLVGLWTKEHVMSISIGQFIRFAFFLLLIVSTSVEAFIVENADETVFLIVITLVATVQVFRMYGLIWKQGEIMKITQDTGVYSVHDSKVFSSVTKKFNFGLTLLKYFHTCLVLALTTVIITPVVTRRVIFNVAFPWDYENSDVAFWMVYAFFSVEALLSIVCCMFAPITWYLMMNLIIKYDIVGNLFKNLFIVKSDVKNPKRKITPAQQNRLFLKQFVEAIKIHEETYATVEYFASTFSNVFLLQIVTSSICICGPIYMLAFSTHEDLFKDFAYSAALFYCSVDIFMLMYLGNEIKSSSDRLSLCLYESNWIGQTESCKWLLLIVVERLRKPQELIVGKLFPLNLKTFDTIVHRAYSIFNVLLNLRN